MAKKSWVYNWTLYVVTQSFTVKGLFCGMCKKINHSVLKWLCMKYFFAFSAQLKKYYYHFLVKLFVRT